jgi:hypothetical protein
MLLETDMPVIEAISIASSISKMIAAIWAILDARLMTEHPTQNMYSADYGIQAHKRRACTAHIMALGTIGGIGRKKPMRVSIGVQDHAGRWHKLVFRGLRDPSIRR